VDAAVAVFQDLMRRLAERPANLTFIVGNVVKESLRRK
jgi:hypothetical protein